MTCVPASLAKFVYAFFMSKLFKTISLMLSALALSLAAHANSSINYSELLTNRAQIQGQGRMTYWGFDLYDAKLLQLNQPQGASVALKIDYLKSFKSENLREQTIKEMKQLGVSSVQRDKWSVELKDIFPDVKPGHSITAIYQPKVGTIFLHNEKYVGKVSGDEFSKAFFAIWLDPRTSAPQLRSQLLSESCTPAFISPQC